MSPNTSSVVGVSTSTHDRDSEYSSNREDFLRRGPPASNDHIRGIDCLLLDRPRLLKLEGRRQPFAFVCVVKMSMKYAVFVCKAYLAFQGSLCLSDSRSFSKKASTSASHMPSQTTSTFLANSLSSTFSGNIGVSGYFASSHSSI